MKVGVFVVTLTTAIIIKKKIAKNLKYVMTKAVASRCNVQLLTEYSNNYYISTV